MKKLICILLSVLLLLSLAACGGAQTPAENETPTPSDSTPVEEPKKPEEAFFFVSEGVKLIPGKPFDPSLLPEANDMFEVPSCAIEGTDNVYSYDSFELTAYDDGTGEVVYSIYLIDFETPTEEGLYLGDDRATVESIYGTDYEDNDGELVYTKGDTQLRILIDEDDVVVSIEYYMVTE